MTKNKTLNIETKIELLKNLNNAMIDSKRKIYDLNNFNKEFVKSNESDAYEHAIIYLTWLKEKNFLDGYSDDLEENVIEMLELINIELDKIKLKCNFEKKYNEGVTNMINKNIIIKEIKDFSNSGIYYLNDEDARKIISSEGKVIGYLSCMEKINILNIIIDSILDNTFNEIKKDSYDKIFSNIFDRNNIMLEKDINLLYSKVMLNYYKPKKDFKEIKKIRDSIVKTSFIEENNDYKVKNLTNERVCYM